MSSTPLPRDEFAVTDRYLYFNHAATGIIPQRTVLAMGAYARAHAERGVLGTYPYDENMPAYRETIGRFIGARGSEISIVPNTGEGANVVALGIDWKPGDRVLLCDNEFPANAIPWVALRRRGVEVQLLDASRQRLTPDVLRREIAPNTRVVTVSWVSYGDGYMHDLAGLAEVAHASGALLCVDAIQGLGAFPIDVEALGVDTLYSGAQKWLMGLHGSGVLYVRKPLVERLHLAKPGWRSVADMWDFHNYEQPYTPDAMRFEGGTPNALGAMAMARAIELFEQCGIRAIASHVIALTDRLCEGLGRLGADVLSPRGDGISSGIVAFAMPGCDSLALGKALQDEGVVTTWRRHCVRVSPHGYNTIEEIDRLLELVAQYAPKLAAKA